MSAVDEPTKGAVTLEARGGTQEPRTNGLELIVFKRRKIPAGVRAQPSSDIASLFSASPPSAPDELETPANSQYEGVGKVEMARGEKEGDGNNSRTSIANFESLANVDPAPSQASWSGFLTPTPSDSYILPSPPKPTKLSEDWMTTLYSNGGPPSSTTSVVGATSRQRKGRRVSTNEPANSKTRTSRHNRSTPIAKTGDAGMEAPDRPAAVSFSDTFGATSRFPSPFPSTPSYFPQRNSPPTFSRDYFSPMPEYVDPVLEVALAESRRELEDRELAQALMASIDDPLPPPPSETFDASSETRPSSDTMLAVQLETAYYSRELEIFLQKWIVELALGAGSRGKRTRGLTGMGGAAEEDGGKTYRFGQRGTIIESDRGGAKDVGISGVEYNTLSPAAQTLITYQALRDLTPYPTTTPVLTFALFAAQSVIAELQSTFGPVIAYEPVDDEAKRAFAVLVDERLADPSKQFDVDVRLWLRLMGEKDMLMKEARERVGRIRRRGEAIMEDLDAVDGEGPEEDEDERRLVMLETKYETVFDELKTTRVELAAEKARTSELESTVSDLVAAKELADSELAAAVAKNEREVSELLARLAIAGGSGGTAAKETGEEGIALGAEDDTMSSAGSEDEWEKIYA